MSVHETGFNKGEEILSECDKGRRWTDHMDDVSVEREHDKRFNDLDTFCVVERLRGNRSHTWATGMTFDDARDLAERLVVGKGYLPPHRKK